MRVNQKAVVEKVPGMDQAVLQAEEAEKVRETEVWRKKRY